MSTATHANARLATVVVDELIRDERLRYRSAFFSLAGDAERYAEAMRDYDGWGEFPPVTCVELNKECKFRVEEVAVRGKSSAGWKTYPAGSIILVGGFTRTEAATLAGLMEIPATIHTGDWDLALRLAWAENSNHGKARTSDEIRQVLQSIHQLPEYAQLGERDVAKLAGCSRATVNRFRASLKEIQRQATEQQDVEPPERPASAKTDKSADEAFVASLKDKWHRPVPPHLRSTFEVNHPLDLYAKRLRDVVQELGRLKHGPDGSEKCLSPGLIALDLAPVSRSLLQAADLVDSNRPFLVCPYCDGAECDRCNGRGWLTRPESEHLPPLMERKASSYREGAAL